MTKKTRIKYIKSIKPTTSTVLEVVPEAEINNANFKNRRYESHYARMVEKGGMVIVNELNFKECSQLVIVFAG